MKPNNNQHEQDYMKEFFAQSIEVNGGIDQEDGLILDPDDFEDFESDIPFLDLDIPEEDGESCEDSRSNLLVYAAHHVKDGLCTCKQKNCPLPGKHPCSKYWSDRLERCTGKFLSKCKGSLSNIALATGERNKLIVLDIPSSDASKYIDYLSRVGKIVVPDTVTITRKNHTMLLYRMSEACVTMHDIWGLRGLTLNANDSYVVLSPAEFERLEMDKFADGSMLRDLIKLWTSKSEEMMSKYPLPSDYDTGTSVDFLTEVFHPTPNPDEVMPGLSVGEVGILAGAPGVGKTWLSMLMAIWLALDLPLYDGLLPACGRTRRVMFITFEEGRERVKKRMAQLLRSGGYTAEQLAVIRQNVLIEVLEGNEDLIDPNGNKNTRMLSWLVSRAQGIDLLILDPLARLIKSDENDATSATMAIEVLEYIARTVGCGLLITHHVSKDGTRYRDKADAYSLRGSSAWTGAVRWQVNTWKMSDVEKSEYGLIADKAIGVSVSKANNAPTTASIACYKFDRDRILEFAGLLPTSVTTSETSKLPHAKTKPETPGFRTLDRKSKVVREID